MIKVFKRWWNYLTARANSSFNERADPKVQLEQAITDAQDQHRRLTEQAANVIANQKQTEMRLNRAMEQLEKTNGLTRQALVMANDANNRGDGVKAKEYNQAAESFANQLVSIEKEVDSLKTLHLQSAQAADQAKSAVQQNSAALQQKLAERQKLLSQLDQAKMQEQMNRAMSSLSEAVGQDVPSFEEVRTKIEARYARALGAADIQGATVESRMLEVEQAQLNTEAQSRLAELRTQMGLPAASELPGIAATSSAPAAPAEAEPSKTEAPTEQGTASAS